MLLGTEDTRRLPKAQRDRVVMIALDTTEDLCVLDLAELSAYIAKSPRKALPASLRMMRPPPDISWKLRAPDPGSTKSR